MIEPFDSEFISQELRDAWKKIERLEEENKKLQGENNAARDYIKWCDNTITSLIKERDELQEKLDFYKLQEELDEERREYYDDSWEGDNLIGDRHEMGG